MEIRHTSATDVGQIYMPAINWSLMIACVGLVLGFRTSSNLAAAYGVAVTTTMLITTVLLAYVMRRVWNWPLGVVVPLAVVFLAIDLAFFSANLFKIPQGGWFPLVAAAIAFTLLTTWRRGRQILVKRLEDQRTDVGRLIEDLRHRLPSRAKGTAVYMTADPASAPSALMRNLEHNHVLHKRVFILSFRPMRTPRVASASRVEVDELGLGIWRVQARYGFMEEPDVRQVFAILRSTGFEIDWQATTFFLGREQIIASTRPGGMALWREKLFAVMTRNAQRAGAFYKVPPERVIELGANIEM